MINTQSGHMTKRTYIMAWKSPVVPFQGLKHVSQKNSCLPSSPKAFFPCLCFCRSVIVGGHSAGQQTLARRRGGRLKPLQGGGWAHWYSHPVSAVPPQSSERPGLWARWECGVRGPHRIQKQGPESRGHIPEELHLGVPQWWGLGPLAGPDYSIWLHCCSGCKAHLLCFIYLKITKINITAINTAVHIFFSFLFPWLHFFFFKLW